MFKKNSTKIIFIFLIITVCNLAVVRLHDAISGSENFNFLVWNLFLGFLPLLVTGLMFFFQHKINNFIFILCSFMWLLFYPNAPYMISDLIHVQGISSESHLLYDTLIIFSVAMLSVFYGFYSSYIIHGLLKNKIGKKWAAIIIGVSLVLCSFGIFLGRVLRLNSWDLFTKPLDVCTMIIDHLFPITKNPSTYMMVFVFTGIQIMLLVLIKFMNLVGENSISANDSKS